MLPSRTWLFVLLLVMAGFARADESTLSLDDEGRGLFSLLPDRTLKLWVDTPVAALRPPIGLDPALRNALPDLTDVLDVIHLNRLKIDSSQPRLVLRDVFGSELNLGYQDPDTRYAGTLGLHWTPFRPIPLTLLQSMPPNLKVGDLSLPLLVPSTALVRFDVPLTTFGSGRRPSPEAELLLNFELPAHLQ